jgi:nucleoside-diphosphate-sugar epimerase
MIIGNGMIAKVFSTYANRNDVVIFASGSSNSKTANTGDYERERRLLSSTLAESKDRKLVYFSTCSVTDPSLRETSYVQHKLQMEGLIREKSKNFLILRLSQAVGVSQSPTVLNFLHAKIKAGETFELWTKSFRNLIDVEDIFKIADFIIDSGRFNCEVVNVASSRSISVLKLVEQLEKFLGIRANFEAVETGADYAIDVSQISGIANQVGVQFDSQYEVRLIEKYYGGRK